MSGADDVDWQRLRSAALDMTLRSFAPYSGLAVGAAGLAEGGTVVQGCNVENSSYGLTLCAECGLVSDFYRQGCSVLRAVCVVNGDGDLLMPCGRCRQLLLEVGGPDVFVAAPAGPIELAKLLPAAFGPEQVKPAEMDGS